MDSKNDSSLELGGNEPLGETSQVPVPGNLPSEATNLKYKSSVLNSYAKEAEEYSEKQVSELIEIQSLILDLIKEKMFDASFDQLVRAFNTLKDKELIAKGKPNSIGEVRGLIGHIMAMGQVKPVILEGEIVDDTPRFLRSLQ